MSKPALVTFASLLLAACGEEKKEEEPFELEPPAPGFQIHLERQTLEPNTSRTVCEERVLQVQAEAFVSHIELLATPPLKRLEIYAVDDATGASAADCAMLPLNVMGDPSEPIRMLYYGTPGAVEDEVRDDFRLPEDAAMPVGVDQAVVLRYVLASGAEPEDFELFVNFHTVNEPALAAAPYTFSIDEFTIAPMVFRTVDTTCDFVRDTTVLTVAGHQHSYAIEGGGRFGAGAGVTVESGGATLLEGEAGPWALLDPLILLSGEGLTITCAYDNLSGEVVAHGTTKYDEMCRVFGWLYPAPNGAVMGSTMPDGGVFVCNVIDSVD